MSGEIRPVGVAVIGTGFGCLTHVPALQAAGFDIKALVGRDPERTAKRAARLGVPAASLEEALSRPEIEAVTIATPPDTHGPLVMEAVSAGKHVLCEKPFARDAPEARRMLEAAEAAGVVHLVGTEFRWATGQALLRRVVTSGRIGAPRLATFILQIPLLADPAAEVPEWWSDGGRGGGWTGAQASHVIDQIRVTLGEFEGVSAGLPSVAEHGWTAEDSYVVHFRLVSGVEGVMQSSAADWGSIVMISRIAGTEGTASLAGDVVSISDRTGTQHADVPPDLLVEGSEPPPADLLVTAYDLLHSTGIDRGPYIRLATVFRDRILGLPVADDPPPATFADGVAGMAVLDAIRASAAERRWVRLDELA
jgi:predicted dehydrogenase